MSQNYPPPNPDNQWQPQQPPSNPKAAAKAAKAYANAERPWFKRKRFIIPAALVALFIAAGVLGSGSGTGPSEVTAADGDKKAAGSKQVGTESNPAKVGQTLKLEGTQYTVQSARTSPTVGSDILAERADGVYVVVELTIENKKDETKTFFEDAAKFVGSNGKSYSTDSDGSLASENPLIFEDMQPDVAKTGLLVFDVPPESVAGGVLEVSDLFGRGEAYISLGLK